MLPSTWTIRKETTVTYHSAREILTYDTVREFNVNWKTMCGHLNLARVTENKKNI